MGQVFAGRYELLDPIADGSMSSVWRVRDREDDTVKAAKILRQQDATSLLRFVREQGTRIHHDHVVTPLGWAGADDAVLFTMPLLRGGSVATLIGDYGALPPRWVAELLVQALAGLGAVHAAGVVHRDIKPGNLLLEHTGTARPHLRITDFGVSVPTGEPRLTRSSITFGTPGYMAPEQERGADPAPAQDLYAVAVTGLQMLTGAPPPHDPWALPDEPLVEVLLRAADPDPSRRPADAAGFAALVRQAVPATEWDPGEIEVLDQWSSDVLVGQGAGSAPIGHHGAPWWPIVLLLAGGVLLLLAGGWILLR
ncbi:serine/threonine-protein kinase [Nocardioides sp. AE5]|uniref:serine/threonine-protein kinase n=1 Tax=Nocardioides sp. AE5 TaxID=2962573 RepID=UPI002881EAF0|nr:serine/threonine-protein kinase [Nocardioides sp. AE5]MDT0201670.1 serine/threonine-protein kinase [Nocardioides sp. AE5]